MSEIKTFFSTFVTGTEDIIEKAIKKRPIDKIKIIQIMDGFIVYDSAYQIREIRNIRFFNNSFILLKQFKSLGENALQIMMEDVIKDQKITNLIRKNIQPKEKSFKIVTSQENQTVSIDRALLRQLEVRINKESGLTLNIKRPAIEFWFLSRRDGQGFFGIRITNKTRDTQRGSLRPELANILCLASDPKPKEVFLDPFAGSGSIPLERAIGFPYGKILAMDDGDQTVGKLKDLTRNKKNFIVNKDNALELKTVSDDSIDKIVTDPPWGMYKELGIQLAEFYNKVLMSFDRVLKPGGVIIMLTANKTELEQAMENFSKIFTLLNQYDILVSGKKAAIYKVKKL